MISLLLCFYLLNPQTPVSAEQAPLSMKQYLELAKKNDPDFKKILSNNQKAQYVIDLGLPSQQITLEAGSEYGVDVSESTHSTSISGSVSKEIIESGTEVSVGHTHTSRPDRDENVTEFRVTQSLFKNLLGRDVRLQKESLNQEAEAIRLEVLESYEEYLQKKSGEFLDFQESYLDMKLAETIYQEAVTLRTEVLKKKQLSIATQTDLDRSDLLVLLKEEDLISKRKDLHSKRQSIQRTIGEEQSFDSPDPSISLPFTHAVLTETLTPESAESLRPFKIAKMNEEIASKDLLVTQRSQHPDLELVAGFDIDHSTRFSSQVNRNEAIVGINFEFPLWNTQGSAEVESAQLTQSQAELTRQSTQQTLKQKLEDLRVQLKESLEQLNVSKQKVDITERILKDEERRYRLGKIDLEQLIDTKNNYAEYRFSYQSDQVAYNKAVLAWLSLNDRLLE